MAVPYNLFIENEIELGGGTHTLTVKEWMLSSATEPDAEADALEGWKRTGGVEDEEEEEGNDDDDDDDETCSDLWWKRSMEALMVKEQLAMELLLLLLVTEALDGAERGGT